MVRGYGDIWDAVVEEELPCKLENENRVNPFAVAVVTDDTVIGHIPRKISSICSLSTYAKMAPSFTVLWVLDGSLWT